MNQPSVEALDHEIAEEKAGALGRAGRRLEHAVTQWREQEQHASREPGTDSQRERLLWELAERLEAFVVQREACGLRDSSTVLRFYGIPVEAWTRVGAARRTRASSSSPSRER
jgi:hypothetical protein